MFTTRLVLSAIALLAFSSVTTGQNDFFLSFDDLNQGATNSDAMETLSPGDTGSLYIYWSTNGPADSDISTGAFVDLQTSQSGVIQFTSAETIDFNITLFGGVVGPRWGDSVGATANVSDDFVDELSAFTIFSGLGILEANNGASGVLDLGFDANADAFQFGKVDFIVLPAPAANTVDITISTGSGGIVNQGAAVNATFGIATIDVSTGPLLGDVNQDGQVDMFDVDPFIQVILSGGFQAEADIDGDGAVNLRDVTPFVALL